MTGAKNRLVVLSNKNQYDRFLKEGYDPRDFLVLCDNEPFYSFLDAQGFSYGKIDEFLLRDRWEDINRWGWSKAAGLIRLMRENGHFKDIDLPSTVFLWISVLLILLLKNRFYALHIIETYQPSEVVIFSPQNGYVWRDYSGNSFLNHCLGETAGVKKILVWELKMEWAMEVFRPPQSKFKQALRSGFKKVIQRCYGMLARPDEDIDVMAYGGLGHLGPTMVELKSHKAKVVFYDQEFRLGHFLFSLKNRIPYLIPECFPDATKRQDGRLVDRLKDEVARAFAAPFMKDFFVFDRWDLGPFVRDNFFGKMEPLFQKIAWEAAQYETFLSFARIGSFLLHEDFNAQSFLANFMKKKNIPVFCISHANWVIDSFIPPEDRVFANSYTFVLSQQEKDAYSERGWDPENLLVTGIPRYDRLLKMIQNRLWTKGSVKILFCAAFFYPFSADTVGFLGLNIFCHRRHQELAVRMLAKAAEGLPITIVIKPQFEHDEPLWRQFSEKELPQSKAVVVKASEDYFKLLMESDVMALCMWSSTIIEAGLADVPNFYLNLDGQDSGHVDRYRLSGLCEVFENEVQLKQRLERLCSSDRIRSSLRFLSPQQEYYLGSLDGNANLRVAAFILNKIEKRKNVAF